MESRRDSAKSAPRMSVGARMQIAAMLFLAGLVVFFCWSRTRAEPHGAAAHPENQSGTKQSRPAPESIHRPVTSAATSEVNDASAIEEQAPSAPELAHVNPERLESSPSAQPTTNVDTPRVRPQTGSVRVELRALNGESLKGHVVRLAPSDGRPRLRGERTAVSSSDGVAVFDNVDVGRVYAWLDVASTDAYGEVRPNLETTLRLALAGGCEIRGTVVDHNRNRAPSAHVHMLINGRTCPSVQDTVVAITDPNGEFSIPCPNGWAFYAVMDGSTPSTVVRTGLAPNRTSPPIELRLGGPGCTLEAGVVDAVERPVLGARVSLRRARGDDMSGWIAGPDGSFDAGSEGPTWEGTVGDTGSVRVFNLPKGEYEALVDAPGFPAQVIAVQVHETLQKRTLILTRGISIQGRVSIETITDLGGAFVRFGHECDVDAVSAFLSETGEFELSPVPKREATLEVRVGERMWRETFVPSPSKDKYTLELRFSGQ